MKIHTLKIDGEFFEEVVQGRKTYELRKNDRNFKVGDGLLLRETRFSAAMADAGYPVEYTGRELRVEVTQMLTGPRLGLEAGWSILSIKRLPDGLLPATGSEQAPVHLTEDDLQVLLNGIYGANYGKSRTKPLALVDLLDSLVLFMTRAPGEASVCLSGDRLRVEVAVPATGAEG